VTVIAFEAPEAARLLARARHENFPVASRWLSRAQRTQLFALYGFARLADELGDEAQGDRLALLDELDRDLDRLFAGAEPRAPQLQRLAPTVRELRLPELPFRQLIEANRQDQRVTRYARWQELREYCALSANPVGRLVLHVFGAATPERFAPSDAICTALQLVEHCQDVAEDLARGRLYLPAEDLARFGVDEADLRASRSSDRVRELLRFELARVRALLASGAPLVRSLRGRARLAVAGFVAGGCAAADGIERRGFEVLAAPPRTRRRDFLRRLPGAWLRAPGAWR
jgi:squalene synthase HpnC